MSPTTSSNEVKFTIESIGASADGASATERKFQELMSRFHRSAIRVLKIIASEKGFAREDQIVNFVETHTPLITPFAEKFATRIRHDLRILGPDHDDFIPQSGEQTPEISEFEHAVTKK